MKNNHLKSLMLMALTAILAVNLQAKPKDYLQKNDILYRDATVQAAAAQAASQTDVEASQPESAQSQDAYITERCRLDIYYPTTKKDCPVVIWFHAGGLTSGGKHIPEKLKNQGLVVVAANYRLLPDVTIDQCIDDAAAAIAWTFHNIAAYNGSTEKIFVSGHSAGGYLTMMTGLNKSYLAKYGIDADRIKALVPFSGQAISHFAYRQMNGIGNLQPTVDEYAPLYHVRPDAPPLILITGDREEELFGRYEENAYLWRMMKLAGHGSTRLYEIAGHGHGPMADPAFHILLHWIKQLLGEKSSL